ncbi:hypothetical protein EJ994_11785 [Maribacter sp. MJ134]|uniref:hypothetical protein n=1 Tax=Maribacter sp. MJ134 TaxID=2496865 RepID=UPI000F84DF3C|nr:hypothetical protein [Maribacter sp. MJ134]AZQ59454.1 hypothetical protein EJ994_11785 [Maribacter sp. MJ134]
MTTELKLLTLIASNKAILSEKGKRISENGGWLKYIEDEKLKADRSKRKDKWDYYYSKYRYFTYWWIFSFSVIAFILSIYNFIQTLQSPRNEVNKEATRTPIQQREGEAAKPHTSSSVPQTSDSLKTPNQENNSLQFEPQKDSLKQKSK